MSRIMKLCLAIAACLSFSACAAKTIEPVDREQALQERVVVWNQARIEQDVLAAYELIWSGYRDVVPLRDYPKRRSGFGKINEYHVEEINVSDDVQALIVLITSFDAFGYALEGRREEQEWVLENGQWYIKIEPVISTPFGSIPIKKPAEQ